ncbi:MAG: hypothetical protein ACTSX9_02015 [Candidatus Njordarchaeales archaeon]
MVERKGISVWFAKPIKIAILEILEKHHGRITESTLRDELKKIYGEVSSTVLNRALMQLEIDGLIHVEVGAPKERVIEKLTRERRYFSVGED